MGNFHRCEECWELVFKECPDYITVYGDFSGLPSPSWMYFTDKNNYKWSYQIESQSGEDVQLSVGDMIADFPITPFSGPIEFSISESATENTRFVVNMPDGNDYNCFIIKFTEE